MKKLITCIILLSLWCNFAVADPGDLSSQRIDNLTLVTNEGTSSRNVIAGDQESFVVHVDAEDVTSTTGYMLVDLSDTSSWDHEDTGHADIIWLTMNVNPNNSFVGDIEFGYLSNVDASNGDFNIMKTWHLEKQAAEIAVGLDHSWSHLGMKDVVFFGPISEDDTTWQTDTNIQGPAGNIAHPSGDGDVVLKVQMSAGAVDVGITIGYHTVE